MKNSERRALEALWRDRLQNARIRYQAAKAAVQVARELQSDATSPDGSFAFNQALKAESHSLAELKRALEILNDLVNHDKIP